MERLIVSCNELPEAVGPYSQMVRYGDLLFLSGQIYADAATGRVIPLDAAGQTRVIMELIKGALKEAGSGMDQVLKCTVHLSDAKFFGEMNAVYQTYFPGGYPARLCVSGVQLYGGVDVEIDVIAGI